MAQWAMTPPWQSSVHSTDMAPLHGKAADVYFCKISSGSFFLVTAMMEESGGGSGGVCRWSDAVQLSASPVPCWGIVMSGVQIKGSNQWGETCPGNGKAFAASVRGWNAVIKERTKTALANSPKGLFSALTFLELGPGDHRCHQIGY